MRCVSEKTLARIARMLTGLPLTASLLTAQRMTEEKESRSGLRKRSQLPSPTEL